MATLLINVSNITAPIPFFSANNCSIHNPHGVEAIRIKEALLNQYMTTFSVSYNTRKSTWNQLSNILTLDEAELIESLTVHSYDADISEKRIRSFNTTKLIDFIPTDLKNTNDYLKSLKKFVMFVKM